MNTKRPLPRTLQLYVDYIAAAGRPVEFTEVVNACTPGRNTFRLLHQRGLIRNTVKGYEGDEPYTGPRMPLYVLTEKGQTYVTHHAE